MLWSGADGFPRKLFCDRSSWKFWCVFPAHIKWLFLPEVGVGSVLWGFILFQFYCSGCKCDVWKVVCFLIYHVKTFFATKHLFINTLVGDVKHSCLLTVIMIKDEFLKYSTGEPFNTLHCAKGQYFTIPNLRTAQYHIKVGFKVLSYFVLAMTSSFIGFLSPQCVHPHWVGFDLL